MHALLTQTDYSIYSKLGNNGILPMLRNMLSTGRVYKQYLSAYPDVRCEPLEVFYQCRRGMGALDSHLCLDLLQCYSWREANWGLWLAALSPNPDWVDVLRATRDRLQHGNVVAELALCAAGAPVPDALCEHVDALLELRKMLQILPHLSYPMRLTLPLDKEARYQEEVASVLDMQRRGDTRGALAALRIGLLGYYTQSRVTWLCNGAGEID